jgi:hypothetical protein
MKTEAMKREKLGSYPYEIERSNQSTVIVRFFPKKPDAKFPDDAVLKLVLTEKDKQKLKEILSI